MTLPASGTITALEIATEFTPLPVVMSQLYRGGARVADLPTNTAIPTSGQISFSEFYGTQNGIISSWVTSSPAALTSLSQPPSFIEFDGSSVYVLSAYDGSAWTSTDLSTWTQRIAPSGLYFTSLQRLGANFVATTNAVAGATRVKSSPTGTTWSNIGPTSGDGLTYVGTAYNGSTYVLATNNTTAVYTATTLGTWTIRSTGLPGSLGTSVTYDGTNFILAATNLVATSSNGIMWTNRTHPFPATYKLYATSAGSFAFLSGKDPSSSASGLAYSTNHGVTWTLCSDGAHAPGTDAATNGSSKYAIADIAGNYVGSLNGTTWYGSPDPSYAGNSVLSADMIYSLGLSKFVLLGYYTFGGPYTVVIATGV